MIQFPVFLLQTKADAVHGVENSTYSMSEDDEVLVFTRREFAEATIEQHEMQQMVVILQVNSLEFLEFALSGIRNPRLSVDGKHQVELSSLFQ